MQHQSVPLIGLRVGRYVILSRIGQGGMGVVYSAYDEELDRRVAIKMHRIGRSSVALGRARIQREAKALARLSHPNVVHVYDVGMVAEGLFIAMEFVRGESLRSWQSRHDPVSYEGRRAIIEMYKQAGRGLAAAHAKGVIHRDFKPDNVIVGNDGRARVLDFGLASGAFAALEIEPGDDSTRLSLGDAITQTGTIMGTPRYMAPEQFRGEQSDPRTDVFSFAAALDEALCGEAAFAGKTYTVRQAAVLGGEFREPTGLPVWIKAVLRRGLQLDPEERYVNVRAMLVDLAEDPAEHRWLVLGRIGLGLAGVLIGVGAVLGGQWLWQSLRSARGGQADAPLIIGEGRIHAPIAFGAENEAEQIFAAFVGESVSR